MSIPEADYLSRLREALAALRTVRSERDALLREKAEPIAIVGMSCRFPGGGADPDSFWQALLGGVDAIREIPPERWSGAQFADRPGARYAGLLDAIDRFDAAFFGISPREAESIEPQQRLLLEVAWEALESAGQRVDRLLGSRTGVFVGVSAVDYQRLMTDARGNDFDAYSLTGNILATAAGRLSYALGLQGPAVSLDTACSSSLVAVHLACQSLRFGESDLALAGGVNLLLSPITMGMVAATQALSPDGRCKTFDARANGFVRSEGCGLLALKRLGDAQRDGDPILALIRGSAVNQDGRSTGLTTPNVLAQQALLEQAQANARISPDDMGYVETHGTGTSLGDPIEFEALKKVLGRPREDGSRCVLGALKTNIGHLEPASGVAGLIKAIQALRHGRIPGNLHFRTLNPRISLEGTPFVVPTEDIPWPAQAKRRHAGVSAFGISGTNAHVILEEAPVVESRPAKEATAHLLPLSAKTPEALVALAKAHAERLASGDGDRLADVAYTASVRRTHHEHRLAVVGATRRELSEQLASFARGQAPAGVVRGAASRTSPRTVYVFSGQGSQWAGMGQKLLAEEEVFKAKLAECDRLLRQHVSWSLLEELAAPQAQSRLGDTDVVQPALLSLQVALAELLKAWGVTPDAVIGHSVGEIAAAHVSGALSLAESLRLAVLRGRIMQKATGLGRMAWVLLGRSEAAKAIAGHGDRLSIAAVNDPVSVVLSGEASALDSVLESLARGGVDSRPLRVNYAFHSPQMDPLARELEVALGRVEARPSAITMYSTVTGALIRGDVLNAAYWRRNVRETVNLAQAVEAALSDGHRLMVEVGPHPVLLANLQQCVAARAESDAHVLPSLRRRGEELGSMLEALGGLYAHGLDVDWKRLFPAGGQCVALPAYPWQRERFWIDAGARNLRGASQEAGGVHPLLGAPVEMSTAPGARVFQRRLRPSAPSYLADHRVAGEIVFPGAGYIEMALSAALQTHPSGAVTLEDLSIEQKLVLDEESDSLVQLVLERDGATRASFVILSRKEGSEGWIRHAAGRIVFEEGEREGGVDIERPSAMQERCASARSVEEHYERMEAAGLSYGPAFRGLEGLWMAPGRAVGRVALPEAAGADDAHTLHPALLDACFQALDGALTGTIEGTFIPIGAERLRLLARPGHSAWVEVQSRGPGSADELAADFRVVDDEGRLLVEVKGLRLGRLRGHARPDPLGALVHAVVWRRKDLAAEPTSPNAPPAGWLVLCDRGGTGAALVERLRAGGARCVRARAGAQLARLGVDEYVLDPANPDHHRALLAQAFAAGASFRGVVHAFGLDATPWEGITPETLEADASAGVVSALHVGQALVRAGLRDTPRLVLLTRGAQVVCEDEGASVSQAPLWGLGRTMALEHPELACLRLDLASRPHPDEAPQIAREILSNDAEDQVALRHHGRHVARLSRDGFGVESGRATDPREPSRGRPFRLAQPSPGILERLELREMARRPPGPGEVEVEVEAVGLNFIDVLKAMGIYPGAAGSAPLLGTECAGRVVAVGEGVTRLSVGQEVVVAAMGVFATHVVARAELVMPKPAGLSFVQAAALPAVYTTVVYALQHVGRAQRGEKILIHSATGGTGLAAIATSRALGLEVFATAGSEEKRAHLRSMGIEHVMDSRTLSFADEIMERTGGQGVDLVLNSLTGDAIVKGLGVLAPYGRFLELGKRDIYNGQHLGLLAFTKALSYTAIDLAPMAMSNPSRFGALFEEVIEKLEDGTLAPLPTQVFPASRVDEAFRLMAQAKHIGKIVVTMKDPDARIVAAERPASRITPDGSYMVTGGLGGLGLSVARWLGEQGARHIALMGRSEPSAAAREAIGALEASGVNVRVFRADVSRRADVDAVLSTLEATMPPLRGIVHAAGVVDDHSMLELTADHFRSVYAPKVLGAWNLHTRALRAPLDFFVLYSSATALLGSPGQANYASANAFLDALARQRVAIGLTATSVQWGPFSEVGMAAVHDNRGRRAAYRGLDSLTPAEGVRALGRLLAHPRAEVGVLRLDVRRLHEFYPQAARSPFWSELPAEKGGARAEAHGTSGLREALQSAAPLERQGMVEGYVVEQLGRVLRLPSSRIGRETPFRTLGVDSLMSLEMRNRLESDLGLRLPSTLLFTYPDTSSLAKHLLARLALEPSPVEAQAAPEPPPTDLPELPDTTGAEDFLSAFDASMEKLKLDFV